MTSDCPRLPARERDAPRDRAHVLCVCKRADPPQQLSGHLTNGFPTSQRDEPGFPKQKALGLVNFKVGDRVAYSAAASSQLQASFPRLAALLRLREWMGDAGRTTAMTRRSASDGLGSLDQTPPADADGLGWRCNTTPLAIRHPSALRPPPSAVFAVLHRSPIPAADGAGGFFRRQCTRATGASCELRTVKRNKCYQKYALLISERRPDI